MDFSVGLHSDLWQHNKKLSRGDTRSHNFSGHAMKRLCIGGSHNDLLYRSVYKFIEHFPLIKVTNPAKDRSGAFNIQKILYVCRQCELVNDFSRDFSVLQTRLNSTL